MQIQPLDDTHRKSVNAYIKYLWNGPNIVTRGQMYDTSHLPGFVAEGDGALLGAVVYRPDGDEWEISALFSLVQGIGVGTKLLDTVKEAAQAQGAKRLWLVTTNDDTQAIRFYQKYGFSLKAVHIGGFEAVRRLKAGVPERGNDGIPIEHEFEFEILL